MTSDAAGNAALVNATAVGLNGGTLTVNRGAASPAVDMVISSAIVNYGTSSLIKNGGGILQLTGSSNYSGGTVFAGGILQVGSTAALGPSSGSLTLGGGTLDLHGFNVTAGALSGTSGRDRRHSAAASASILTIGSGGANGTFSATIQNSSGTVSLAKVGGGTRS